LGIDVEQRDDGLVTVWMDWPAKRNALGPADTLELGNGIDRAGSLASIGVVVSGVGSFCAGGDLEQFASLSASFSVDEIRAKIYSNVHSVLRAIRSCPVPVVAAVDGPAVGLGFDYALACDMCFVGSEGWMQQGWAVAGLIHGAGGSAFVQRAGGQLFWRLVADQQRLDGPAAEKLGIAEAAEGRALDAAVERLRRLGRLPREVLEAYTSLFREQRWPDGAFLQRCADFQSKFIGSESFRSRAQVILSRSAAPS
jgi:enoyl-CoA hydratase/carnithine racemase